MMRASKSLVSRAVPLGRRSWRGFTASAEFSPPFDSSEHPGSPLEQLLDMMKRMDNKLDSMDKKFDARIGKLETKVDKLDMKVDDEFSLLNRRMESLEHNMSSLEHNMGSLEHKMGSLERNMSSIDERLYHVERKLGHPLEQHVRVEVLRLHGEGYQKRLVAKSIVDLLELFPPEVLEYSKEGPALSVVKTAKDVAMKLLDANVPKLFLNELNNLSPCVNGKGEPIPGKIREMKKLKQYDDATRNLMDTAIEQLVSYYSCKDEDRVEQLVSAKGPGLLFLLFAVDKNIIFPGGKYFFPFITLEFDLRGNIELTTQNDITVDIGEVKSNCSSSWMEASLDEHNGLTKSIRQLAVRLNVLTWLIRNTYGERREKLDGKPVNIMKVGRVFVPKSVVNCKVELTDALRQQIGITV